MSHPTIREYLRAAGPDAAGAADADLLERFAATGDEAAFELLVWRHAALVQRVCHAVLRDHHAAEDAAQAAFLILARKAGTFAGRGPVVGWLYRVARRAAVRLAKQQARTPELSTELDRAPAIPPESGVNPDEAAALCAEVDRLPERYRVPVLLCFFEGLTHAEAARRTGWPVGTVAGRLARAKDLLARRLTRRGVGVAGVVLAVPTGSFVGATAKAAAAFAARVPVVPGVNPSVARLAEGVIRAMTATTFKLTAAAAAVVCAAGVGVWGYAAAGPAATTTPAVPAAAAAAPVPNPPAAEKPRVADAKQRARSLNNLKQIVLAFHNYLQENSHFPPNIMVKDEAGGKTTLSWRVAILPYLDQQALYKQFRFDEPWDSEHNKKLLDKMPDVYRVGFEPKGTTKTYYQGFAGPGTLFEPRSYVKIASVTDGTSNTLAVVEAGPPVEWTKPEDIPYDPKKPLPKLDGPFTNVLMGAVADGSAHTFKPNSDPATLRRLIVRDDGEVFDWEKLSVQFPLSKEELAELQQLLEQNRKLIGEIAGQLREQQKLLADLGTPKNPNQQAQGKVIDLNQVRLMREELERDLDELKKQNAVLKKEAEYRKK